MKIATYNINNVNKRLGCLLEWLRASTPDVVCLQELKSTDAQFPVRAIRDAGYGAVWCGQKSWNGVAILARDADPIESRSALPGDAADKQSRYIEAAVNGVLIGCLYAPNGNPQPGPKFDYKLAWLERLIAHAGDLYASGLPVVLAGDYNIVPTEKDIYPNHSYADNALLHPKSREAYEKLIAQGWLDGLRSRFPDAPLYTFWGYIRSRWERNAGLRIDHLLLSRSCAARFLDAGVDKAVRGCEGASDHAPAWVLLRD